MCIIFGTEQQFFHTSFSVIFLRWPSEFSPHPNNPPDGHLPFYPPYTMKSTSPSPTPCYLKVRIYRA